MKRLMIVLIPLLLFTSLALASQPASKATAKVSAITILEPTDGQEWTTILMQDIKTPNGKDLFISVSMECGLRTDTKVKGRSGVTSRAMAEAGVAVRVLVDGVEALPGDIMFCKRTQELTATFDGLLSTCLIPDAGCLWNCNEHCTDEYGLLNQVCYDDCAANCGLVIDESCLATMDPEEIGLILDTMAANAFNFVMLDLLAGTHTVEVQAMIATDTDVEDPQALGSSANATGMIGKGSVCVELVRMIVGEDVPELIE